MGEVLVVSPPAPRRRAVTTRTTSRAFVSLFNEPAEYCRCNVYPTTPNPNAAARYRSLIRSLSP